MAKKKLKKSYSNHNLIAAGLLMATVFIFATIGMMYFSVTSERNGINQENFCAKGITESIVILIDHSDKLNVIQKAALQARLWDIAESLPKNYSQINIFLVDKVKENVLVPEIVMCNPGSEKDMSRFTENQKIVRKKYEEKFKKHLDEVLNAILRNESDSQSPIMEALQSVSVTSFIGEKNKQVKKKLILVSDLLQNTSGFSLYRGVIESESYKASNHWKSIKSDLNGVDVELYFLHRKEASDLQNRKLIDFWIQYFENQGARVTRILPIEG